MNKDPLIFLRHILERIERVENYTKKLSKEKFEKNTFIQDAVIRNLEVIGEASKNIPKEFTAQYPEIPWSKIAGFRDILIHFYFGIELDTTWNVVKDDLPNLKKRIKDILEKRSA